MIDDVDAHGLSHPDGEPIILPNEERSPIETTPPTHTTIDDLVAGHQQEEDADAIDGVRERLEQLANPDSPLTLLERRDAFLSRALEYRSSEVDFIDEDASLDALRRAVEARGIVLVGEMHGAVQNADMLYTLCRKLGIGRVALEYPRELQATVDSWLGGEALNFDSIESYPDGRITAEQFAVLRQLKEEGILEEVICMDAADDGTEVELERDRDEAMATNLLNSMNENKKPILAMAGNYHADTVTHEDSDAPNGIHEPFGYRLGQQIGEVPNVTLEYRSGSYHNYGPHDFDPVSIPEADAPLISRVGQNYNVVIPKATMATVPNPNTR